MRPQIDRQLDIPYHATMQLTPLSSEVLVKPKRRQECVSGPLATEAVMAAIAAQARGALLQIDWREEDWPGEEDRDEELGRADISVCCLPELGLVDPAVARLATLSAERGYPRHVFVITDEPFDLTIDSTKQFVRRALAIPLATRETQGGILVADAESLIALEEQPRVTFHDLTDLDMDFRFHGIFQRIRERIAG